MKEKRIWNMPKIQPPINKVLSRMGYNYKKSEITEDLMFSIQKEINEARTYIQPSAVSITLEITKIDSDTVNLERDITLKSVKLAKLLEKSKSVIIFACTIGDGVEKRSAEYIGVGEMTKGIIWDAIGSEAVEASADFINGVIAQEMQIMKKSITKRFSPGYGDLKTDVHSDIMPLLETEDLGIGFDKKNFILKPEKSITAIIGISG
jgi:hypothetical protein